MSEKISKYVSKKEVTHSNTAKARGIDNTPSEEQWELIKACAEAIFDPLREATGGPVKINSVFRSYALNKALKGSSTSQHCVDTNPTSRGYGAAFDIDDLYWVRGLSDFNNTQMGDWIRENCDFDQLIYEGIVNGYPKWIHFSYRPDGNNRNQVLIMKSGKYFEYDLNKDMLKSVW